MERADGNEIIYLWTFILCPAQTWTCQHYSVPSLLQTKATTIPLGELDGTLVPTHQVTVTSFPKRTLRPRDLGGEILAKDPSTWDIQSMPVIHPPTLSTFDADGGPRRDPRSLVSRLFIFSSLSLLDCCLARLPQWRCTGSFDGSRRK